MAVEAGDSCQFQRSIQRNTSVARLLFGGYRNENLLIHLPESRSSRLSLLTPHRESRPTVTVPLRCDGQTMPVEESSEIASSAATESASQRE